MLPSSMHPFEHLPALRVEAGLVSRDQAVDDLLVVVELVLGVLGHLDDRDEQGNATDVEPGEVFLVAAGLEHGRWRCRSRPGP